MPRLHYFYPENDLALARDIPRYTAPPAAVRLRRSGANLPFFYSDAGDEVLTGGTDTRWLDTLRRRLGIQGGVYRHDNTDLAPAPWGWSKAARQTFIDDGFPVSALPSDETLARLRMLSHRRTASEASRLLADRLSFAIAPAAAELASVEEIYSFIGSQPAGIVLKLPWSSSGRGLVFTDPATAATQKAMFEGMLRRQGTLMGEPCHRKVLDFAMLFTMKDGKCSFDGYSLFENSRLGNYSGNILAPQPEIKRRIAVHVASAQLDAVEKALPEVLEELIGEAYEGPLGVDMLAASGAPYKLAPVVEINLRMTMGHVCRIFYDRYVAPGATGTFTIENARTAGIFDADTFDGRILHGIVDLAQPGADFSFIARIGG